VKRSFLISALILVGCGGPADEPSETMDSDMVMEEPMASSTPAPATGPVAPPTTDAEMIASALSAAPPAVGADATIIAIGADGQMRTLREGTGPFTCIPDGPSPGVDPICVDPNGLTWLNAWIAQTPPPPGLVGFGYMLAGGSDASNEDPFATGPAAGENWVDTGPHVMIFAQGLTGYPMTHDDTSRPYMMWPGTPFEHLMAPVR
jgi:hypothetical protein